MNEQDELFLGLPKRPMSHISGDQAVLALKNSLPKEWISRELNSDYGIDCEIEVVNSDGTVTGALCKVQVKGTNSDVELLKYGISISTNTVRYWLALPIPTIIENFEKPFGQTTFYLFIHIIMCYENFNRLRAEGGVQASGTAWRSAGGD